MALPFTGVWEVRPTNGSNTNGGGFDSAAIGTGTDYSVQNAKNTVGSNISTTDLTTTTTGSFTCTSATAAFTSAITGNFIYLAGGTGGTVTTGWYRATYASATTITLDRSPGAAVTLCTMNIGGALQTLGQINTILTTTNENATGQIVWVKAEATISITATITLSPNGSSGSLQPTQINGYTTTRGDNGQVTIQATSTGPNPMMTLNPNTGVIYRNFIVDGNSEATGGYGVSSFGSNCLLENFLVKNCKSGGISFNNQNNIALRCIVTACCVTGGAAFRTENSNGPNYVIDCIAYANSGTGFAGAVMVAIRCISANNTGSSSDGFGGTSTTNGIGINTGSVVLDHCLAYSNGRDGFRISGTGAALVTPVVFGNCIAWGNTGKDIDCIETLTAGAMFNFNNAYVTSTNYTAGPGDVTLSADPTVAGATNNFALNSTAGGGTSCKAAGFPGVLAIGGTGYADIGALQSQGSVTTTVTVIAPTQNRILQNEGE